MGDGCSVGLLLVSSDSRESLVVVPHGGLCDAPPKLNLKVGVDLHDLGAVAVYLLLVERDELLEAVVAESNLRKDFCHSIR